MKVRATKSFASAPPRQQGDVFDLPDGVDWLEVGLVERADEEPAPEPAKPAPARRTRTRKPKP